MTIAANQFEIDTDFHIAGYRAESLMTVGTTKMPTIKRRLYMGSLPTVRKTYTGGLLASTILARSPSSVLTKSPHVSKWDFTSAMCRCTVIAVESVTPSSLMPYVDSAMRLMLATNCKSGTRTTGTVIPQATHITHSSVSKQSAI